MKFTHVSSRIILTNKNAEEGCSAIILATKVPKNSNLLVIYIILCRGMKDILIQYHTERLLDVNTEVPYLIYPS